MAVVISREDTLAIRCGPVDGLEL